MLVVSKIDKLEKLFLPKKKDKLGKLCITWLLFFGFPKGSRVRADWVLDYDKDNPVVA